MTSSDIGHTTVVTEDTTVRPSLPDKPQMLTLGQMATLTDCPRVSEADELDVATALRWLDTNQYTGLSRDEACRRLALFGPNVIEPTRDALSVGCALKSWWIGALMVVVLLPAALGLEVKATWVAIVVVVVFVLLTSAFDQYQNAACVAQLHALERRQLSERHRRVPVLRDNTRTWVGSHELVPGDIVLLEQELQMVDADCRLLAHSPDFAMDEQPLVGETENSKKDATAVLPRDADRVLSTNLVYAGTAVVHGLAKAVVVWTGHRAKFAFIQNLMNQNETAADHLFHVWNAAGARHWLPRVLVLAVGVVLYVVVVLTGRSADPSCAVNSWLCALPTFAGLVLTFHAWLLPDCVIPVCTAALTRLAQTHHHMYLKPSALASLASVDAVLLCVSHVNPAATSAAFDRVSQTSGGPIGADQRTDAYAQATRFVQWFQSTPHVYDVRAPLLSHTPLYGPLIDLVQDYLSDHVCAGSVDALRAAGLRTLLLTDLPDAHTAAAVGASLHILAQEPVGNAKEMERLLTATHALRQQWWFSLSDAERAQRRGGGRYRPLPDPPVELPVGQTVRDHYARMSDLAQSATVWHSAQPVDYAAWFETLQWCTGQRGFAQRGQHQVCYVQLSSGISSRYHRLYGRLANPAVHVVIGSGLECADVTVVTPEPRWWAESWGGSAALLHAIDASTPLASASASMMDEKKLEKDEKYFDRDEKDEKQFERDEKLFEREEKTAIDAVVAGDPRTRTKPAWTTLPETQLLLPSTAMAAPAVLRATAAADPLAPVVEAIKHSRAIYYTFSKLVLFLFSSSITQLLLATLCVMMGVKVPFNLPQLLWIGLVTNVSASSLAADPTGYPGILAEQKQWQLAPALRHNARLRLHLALLTSSLTGCVLAVYLLGLFMELLVVPVHGQPLDISVYAATFGAACQPLLPGGGCNYTTLCGANAVSARGPPCVSWKPEYILDADYQSGYARATTMALACLVWAQLARLCSCRSLHMPVWRIDWSWTAARQVYIAVGVSFVGTCLVCFIPEVNDAIGLTAFNASEFGVVVAGVLVSLTIDEAVKGGRGLS